MAKFDREIFDHDIENVFAEPAGGVCDDRSETVFSRLPGVVNDLPEVAPHEWIYIMS